MNLTAKPIPTMDRALLQQVKRAFVPMPGGQAEPVAGAGMMTAAQATPMGGDPAAMGGGAPMDPAAMGGGAPMDPAAMGGMPPGAPPMDPATMGGAPVDPAAMGAPPMDPAAMGAPPMDPATMGPPDGTVSMPVSQLLELITVLTGGSVEKAKAGGGEAGGGAAGAGGEAKPKKPSSQQMLADIHAALMGGQAQGAAPAAPAAGG